MAISFFPEHILVTHKRTQVIQGGTFDWRVDIMHYRETIEPFDVRMTINNVNASESSGDIIKLIKPYYESSLLIQAQTIFSKSWNQLPIAKDLPRFVNSLFISFIDDEIIDLESYEVDWIKKLKILFSILAKRFKPDLIDIIETSSVNLEKSLPNSDSNALIRDFLETDLRLDNNEPFCMFSSHYISMNTNH